MRQLFTGFIVLLSLILIVAVARGQDRTASPAPSATPSAQASPSTSPTPGPAAIPLVEVVIQAESVQSNLRDIDADLAANLITTTVESELPVLAGEIDARIAEDSRILNSRPSLETLRRLETEWTTLAAKLPVWKRDLTTRATFLDRELARLTELGDTWQQTLLSLAVSDVASEIAQQEGALIQAQPPSSARRRKLSNALKQLSQASSRPARRSKSGVLKSCHCKIASPNKAPDLTKL